MSNHDVYVSLNLSNEDDRKSTFAKTKERLVTVYNVIAEDLPALKPFSQREVRDIEEALKGDYKQKYNDEREGIFLLPEFRSFQERLENSAFDNMNVEYDRSKYRFLVPFIIKAEMSPGLAFGEILLTLMHVLTFISVLINGLTAPTMFVGGCTLFLLLSVVHFWYGISRYPSIWNGFVPIGLRGSSLDRNFAEIREICGLYHNGHSRTNSQIIPFIITLPFTIAFHVIAFLVTLGCYLLRFLKKEEIGRQTQDPVIFSIFLSNILITTVWLLGGTAGIIFSTLTVILNQKAYNSLLFQKDAKDFFISLVFGNFLVISERLTTDSKEISLSERILEKDVEEGIQTGGTTKADIDKEYSPKSIPVPIRSLPPLLGASSSSSDSMVDEEKALNPNSSPATDQNFLSVSSNNTRSPQNGFGRIETGYDTESPAEFFVDEVSSQQTKENLQHIITVIPASQNDQNDNTEYHVEEINTREESKMEELERTRKPSRRKFFGLSRRIFSSSRNKSNRRKQNTLENEFDEELSVEFLNPSDVHIDLENHRGTIEWRNTISESIQRFRIKSYTLRKHNWVMNQMHGKSFFVKENGKRRRKLKRKETKEYCKAFHDKQLHFNSQISGILDDLKDLKKNHNNGKSNSDHTRNSCMNNNTPIKEKASTDEGREMRKENFIMTDSNYQTPKFDAASTTKESLVDSSKESTVSTLTQSLILPENPDERSPCIAELTDGAIRQLNPKENTDGSLTFRDAINGLLQCTPWIDNINLLKESGSKGIEDERQQNNKTKKDAKLLEFEGLENVVESEGDVNRKDRSNLTQPYWQNFVNDEKDNVDIDNKSKEEEGDPITGIDISSGKRRKAYPWRSDLQKKKIEKAQEDRSQSKEFATKQTKRVISIWKKKERKIQPDQVALEQSITHSPQNLQAIKNDNSEELCGNERRESDEIFVRMSNDDNYREKEDEFLMNHPYTVIHLCTQNDGPEMNTSHYSMHKKTTSAEFETECGAFEGFTGVCSNHPVTEQREDVDLSSDVKDMSTKRAIQST